MSALQACWRKEVMGMSEKGAVERLESLAAWGERKHLTEFETTSIRLAIAEIQRYRKALERIQDMKVAIGAEEPKYVQAFQWHQMKGIATEALEGER
jgi:hypothetical protein